MLFWATLNQVSNIIRVKILDSTVSTGAGKTGLAFNTANLLISTIASNESVPTAYTGANIETIGTPGTYSAPAANRCRFKEVHPTNHPGIYELQFANARFAVAGSRYLLLSISGATGMAQCDGIIPLPVQDLFSASMGAQQLVDIKATVRDIFATDPQSEPGQVAPPGATATFFEKMNMAYKFMLRKKDSSGALIQLYNAAGTVVEQKQSLNVNAGVVTKGQWVQGP